MTRGRWTRLNGRVGTRILLLLVLGWLGFGLPIPAASQSRIDQLDSAYRAALTQYDAYHEAWGAQERIWNEAVLAMQAASRSGDEGRQRAADTRAHTAASEMQRLRRLRDDQGAVVARLRDDLRVALDGEMSALAARIRSAGPAEQGRLTTSYTALAAQYQQLQTAPAANPLTYWPEMGADLDPRMPVQSIQATVQLLNRRIADTRDAITRINQQIDRLRKRLADQRLVQDAANTLGRFGSGELPGTNRPPSNTDVSASTAALEKEIADLTVLRDELQMMQHQFEQRVLRLPQGGGGSP